MSGCANHIQHSAHKKLSKCYMISKIAFIRNLAKNVDKVSGQTIVMLFFLGFPIEDCN